MSGIVGLSIDYSLYGNGNMSKEEMDKKFVKELFWSIQFHQHITQKNAGLGTTTDTKDGIVVKTKEGLFRANFENDLAEFMGPLGIGHIGDSFEEPYLVKESLFHDKLKSTVLLTILLVISIFLKFILSFMLNSSQLYNKVIALSFAIEFKLIFLKFRFGNWKALDNV